MCAHGGGARDKELDEILKKIARNIISKGKQSVRAKAMEGGYRTKIVGVDSPHGIYVYDRASGEWVLVRRDGDAFEPWKDGYYVIYFDNTRCPACRIYDLSWYLFVETIGKTLRNTEFVIILCKWFSRECDSEAARNSFKKYNIRASPTTLLLKVEGGKVVKEERIRGAKKIDELIRLVSSFIL